MRCSATPIDASTVADSAVCCSDEDAVNTYSLDTSGLVVGSNSIAVEIHNAGPTSSDISFDLRLYGFPDLVVVAPEPATAIQLGLGLIVFSLLRRRSK